MNNELGDQNANDSSKHNRKSLRKRFLEKVSKSKNRKSGSSRDSESRIEENELGDGVNDSKTNVASGSKSRHEAAGGTATGTGREEKANDKLTDTGSSSGRSGAQGDSGAVVNEGISSGDTEARPVAAESEPTDASQTSTTENPEGNANPPESEDANISETSHNLSQASEPTEEQAPPETESTGNVSEDLEDDSSPRKDRFRYSRWSRFQRAEQCTHAPLLAGFIEEGEVLNIKTPPPVSFHGRKKAVCVSIELLFHVRAHRS